MGIMSPLTHARTHFAANKASVATTQTAPNPLNLKLDVNDPRRKQKLATLCIAYHNYWELEHLKYEECLEKYERALQISEMFLPENREMAASPANHIKQPK